MIKHQIKKDIKLLLENNLISSEQAINIEAFYNSKNSHKIGSALLFPLIGVLLIGSGLIALCASNWAYMSDSMRIVIALAPLTILDCFLFKYKNSNSNVLIQCLTFGVAFALLFALGIITNIFQTPIPTEIFLHLGLFCVLPLIYVFDAYWLGLLTLTATVYTSFDGYIIISIIGLLSLVPYCYFKLKAKHSINLMLLLHTIVLFRFMAIIHEEFISLALGVALLLLIGLFFKNDMVKRNTLLMCYALGCYFSFDDDSVYFEPGIGLVLLAIYAGVIGYVLYYTLNNLVYEENIKDRINNLHCVAILTLIIFNIVEIPTIFIFSALMTYIFGFKAYSYFKNMDLAGYNKYSFVFSAFVLMRMTSLDLPFMAQGVLFIVLGIGFIILSRYVSTLIKKEQAGLEVVNDV